MEESKNKNQTAVQWLIEQKIKFHAMINDDLEKAKAMEKEQIIDAHLSGFTNKGHLEGEQYYNETFTDQP